MTRRRKIILVVLGGLAAALLLVVILFDWTWFRGPIEGALSDQLGRRVEIRGDIDAGLSLAPRITVEDLRIANASWGSAPHMLQVDQLSLVVDVPRLLGSALEVRDVALRGPDVLVERSADGELNWAGLGAAEPDQPSGRPPSIGDITLEDGTLTWRAQEDAVVEIASASGSGGDGDGPIHLQAEGRFAGRPLELAARTGALEGLRNGGQPLPVELALAAGDAQLRVEGSIAPAPAARRAELEISLRSPEPGPLLAALGLPGDAVAPLDTRGTLLNEDGVWALTGLQAEVGQGRLAGRVGVDLQGQPRRVRAELSAERLDLDPLLRFLRAFAPGPEAEESESEPPAFRDGRLDLAILPDLDARIRFDGRDVRFRNAFLEEVQVAAGVRQQVPDLTARGHGSLGDTPVTFDARLGSALRDPERPYPIAVTVESGEDTASVRGSMAEPLALEGLALDFDLASAQPARWLALASDAPPPLPPVRASGQVVHEDATWAVRDLSLAAGESDLRGEGRLELGGARPRIVADLQSDRLVAADFLPETEPGTAEQDEDQESAEPGIIQAAPDLAALPEVDAAISLAVGQVAYQDLRMEPLRLDLKLEDRVPVLDLSGEGTYGEQPFVVEAHLGSEEYLRDPSARYPVQVRFEAADSAAEASGTVGQPLNFTDLDVEVALRGPNLDPVGEVLGLGLPETPPFDLAGRLTHGGDRWHLAGLEGTIGDSDIEGEVSVTLRDPRPLLEADLRSRMLDLDDLGLLVGAAPDTGPGETASPEQAQEAAEEAATRESAPDEPFDVPELRLMDARVAFAGEEVVARKVPLEGMSLELSLEEGRLVLDPLEFEVAGGELDSTIALEAGADALDGEIDMTVRQVSLNRLLSRFDIEVAELETEQEGVGTFSGHARLAVQGRALQDFASSADGDAVLVMNGGRISSIIVEGIGLDVGEITGLLFGDEDPDSDMVPLDCVVAKFGVRDGVMTAEALVMDTADSRVTGAGTIDLGRETLSLEFLANPKDASVLSASTPIRVEGPFQDPKIDVVSDELVQKSVAALALGVLLPVVGAAIPFIEPGDGEEEGPSCAALMADVRQTHGPEATGSDAQ